MILQSFKMAWKAISSNKLRSFLTMLGIIIGVVALVSLVSMVNGATESVTSEISSLGTNKLQVYAYGDGNKTLKMSNLQEIEDLPEVGAAAPYVQTNLIASNRTGTVNTNVIGTTSSYMTIENIELEDGRFIKSIDDKNHSAVAVVGAAFADELFGRTEVVGQTMRLGGKTFTIVGVLPEGNSMSSLFGLYEVYVPFSSFLRLSGRTSVAIDSFVASGATDAQLGEAETAVRDYLKGYFGTDEAFYVYNQSDIMDAMDSVTNVLSILLGGIAAISLLVGGIGIMNIMLVSVTERTREIGIRKAIGASRAAILSQFLIEALVISLIGCAIGIFLSWVILLAANNIAAGSNVTFALNPGVVVVSVIFSTSIGLLFGWYPANKAARSNPIEALRYTG